MGVLQGAAFVIAGLLCFAGISGVVGVMTAAPAPDPTAAFAGSLAMLSIGASWLVALIRRRLGRTSVGTTGLAIGLFIFALGAAFIWNTIVAQPRTYELLQASGSRATATLVDCAPGIGGGHGVGCQLSLDFHGHRYVWAYPENVPQFASLAPGAEIPMLVDPQNPAIAYTVTDVLARTNAGVGPLTFLGLFFMLLGASFMVLPTVLKRSVRRQRSP